MKKILILLLFLLIPETAKAADVIQARLLQSGFFNIYAPTHVDNDLLVGGWPTQNDIGPDKIYRLQSSQLLAPAFAKPGFHVNDPSRLLKKALKEKKFCGREQMWVHI
jgi:hypothetical protein